MPRIRLRDSKKLNTEEIYPINEIPEKIITKIFGHIVYLIGTGRKDISGDDFGDALAKAINGIHYASPVGIVDVSVGKMAWSAKTIKISNPFRAKIVRLISGRNSPDYSMGIHNAHEDIQKTGDAVLQIWNERINVAHSSFNTLRTMVLIRSGDLKDFVLYEENAEQFAISNYSWVKNRNGNLLGVEKQTKRTCFTWQPHGAQFTIHSVLPSKVYRLSLQHPQKLDEEAFLMTMNYNAEWIHFVGLN